MLAEVSKARCLKQLRTEPRMKVMLSGTLRAGAASMSCRVLDISRGGACVEADRPQQIGAALALTRGALHVPGKVVWARGNRCGLRFDEPIRATDLFVQMSASRQALPPALRAPMPVPRPI